MFLDRSRTAPRLFAVIALLGPVVAAQVPDGWYVVSSHRGNAAGAEDGRLFFVHPRATSTAIPPIQVTGLPADLTGTGTSGVLQGASSVLCRQSDGALFVGEISTVAGQSIDLHLITLNGSAVATHVRFPLGTGTGTPGSQPEVSQAFLLPSGDVLVGVRMLGAGPLGGQHLGIVNPTTGAVTPVPVNLPVSNLVHAATADPMGTQAYLGFSQSPKSSNIYRVSLPGGGTPTLVATLPAMVSNLAFDDRGGLVASCVGGGGGPTLFLIAPSTGMVTPIPPVPEIGVLAAFAMEQVTGNFALVTGGAALPGGTTYWAVPGGAATQLTFFQTGWWGLKSGIDVNPDPEKYGAGTPGGNVYSWSLTPNPGGLPTIGNGAFSLTLASSPGTAGGFHVASLARADFPLLGVRVLLDPAQIVLVQPIPAQPSVTLPLPIPSDVAVRGFRLCFQSFHADPQAPQGLAASAGVEVTVL